MDAAASQRPVPGTPRVISPSPTPSEIGSHRADDYFAPVTRSAAKKSPKGPVDAGIDGEFGSDNERARSRSRSRERGLRNRRISGMTAIDEKKPLKAAREKPPQMAHLNGASNGHLSPGSAVKNYWREISRSPSPLGLIPIHREWRSFVHRHEIPRKFLHVSIGFLTISLYTFGYQTSDIPPVLMTFLIPISLVDLLRHNWPPFNRLYIRVLGAFMRESEAHDKYNGVIWYLLGAWTVLRFFPKDVGTVSVLMLSWCDTAASTFGRLYGRYTPRIRKGKSLAGSVAAWAVGVVTALVFWGWFAPRYERLGYADNTGVNAFAYQGVLALPSSWSRTLGLTTVPSVSGGLALGVMSLVAGFIASASEAVDIFGWDDNLTIPVLTGIGLFGFLKVFGDA